MRNLSKCLNLKTSLNLKTATRANQNVPRWEQMLLNRKHQNKKDTQTVLNFQIINPRSTAANIL